MKNLITLLLASLLVTVLSFSGVINADHLPPLPDTALPDPVVPANSFVVTEINDNVYWATQGSYQVMFVVSEEGVMLIDAPEPLPFFPGSFPVVTAVASVTDLPITHLIYSHAHLDHIGGAAAVTESFPDAEIIAHTLTGDILKTANDPLRPVPTRIFNSQLIVTSGSKTLQLDYHGNTHDLGNIFIYAEEEKILAAIDIVTPGWVPFRGLQASTEIAGLIAGHDAILTYDFNALVTGHLTRIGTRDDVLIAQEYLADIKEFVEEGYLDANIFFAAFATVEGEENQLWATFAEFFRISIQNCTDKLDAKWTGVLGGAESFNFSNCGAWFQARRLGSTVASEAIPRAEINGNELTIPEIIFGTDKYSAVLTVTDLEPLTFVVTSASKL